MEGAVRRLTYWLCVGGMFAALPLMFLTAADAVCRSFFSKPLPGVIEISEYLLSVLVLLGAAYTQQVKGHVGVDFLLRRLSPGKRRWILLVTTVLCLAVALVLSVEGLREALVERTVSDMLRIPQKPFRMLVFVAGVMLFLEFLMDLKGLVREGRK